MIRASGVNIDDRLPLREQTGREVVILVVEKHLLVETAEGVEGRFFDYEGSPVQEVDAAVAGKRRAPADEPRRARALNEIAVAVLDPARLVLDSRRKHGAVG